MKNIILLVSMLFSSTVFAGTFQYRVTGWGDDYGKSTPFYVVLKLSEDFNRWSTVEKLEVYGYSTKQGKSCLLFSFDQKALQKYFKVEWTSDHVLFLASKEGGFPSVMKKIFDETAYSDATIGPKDRYGLSSLHIDARGSVTDEDFFIDNETQEEMSINGPLIREHSL